MTPAIKGNIIFAAPQNFVSLPVVILASTIKRRKVNKKGC